MASPIRSTTAERTGRASEDSIGGSSGKRKRQSRPKTCYSICHAPPRHGGRHKIQVRARPLLQLHKIQSRSRPRPAFELLPSAIFSPRLVKAISQFFVSKHTLNPTDLAIVRAEKYHAHEASPIDEDESRDILAVICGFGKGHVPSATVKIMLEDGVEWEACQLPTGSYEATTTDDHGLKKVVRWVPKRNGTKAVTSPALVSPTTISSPADADASVEKKFNFSTISQNTRRHPVIAHLTTSSLDISDVYTLPVPSTSVDSTAPTPMSPSFARTYSDEPNAPTDDTLTTTEELRNIITATAIYVALCEGWCTSYRGEDSMSRSVSQKSVSPGKLSHSPVKGRPSSLESDSIRRTSSLRQVLRSPTFRLTSRSNEIERPPSSSASSTIADPIPTIPEGDSPVTRRRRADTTSTVIVNPNAGQRQHSHEEETDDEEGDVEDHPDPVLRPGSEASGERKRNFSESTFDGSETSGDSAAREKREATIRHRELEEREKAAKKKKQKKKERKSGFLGVLLCGMV